MRKVRIQITSVRWAAPQVAERRKSDVERDLEALPDGASMQNLRQKILLASNFLNLCGLDKPVLK